MGQNAWGPNTNFRFVQSLGSWERLAGRRDISLFRPQTMDNLREDPAAAGDNILFCLLDWLIPENLSVNISPSLTTSLISHLTGRS